MMRGTQGRQATWIEARWTGRGKAIGRGRSRAQKFAMAVDRPFDTPGHWSERCIGPLKTMHCAKGWGAHKRLPRLPPGPRDRLGRDVVHGRRVRAAYCHSYHTGQASHPNRGMTDKGMGRALRAGRPRGKRHGGQVREGLWSGLEWTRPFWRGARPFNVGSGEVSCSAWSSLCRSRPPECTCNIEGARPTARSGPQRAVHSTRPVCSVSFVGSPGRRLEIARSAPRVRRDGKRALVRVNGVVDGLMFVCCRLLHRSMPISCVELAVVVLPRNNYVLTAVL